MSRVVLSDLSKNRVVLPMNVSKSDRNRQRNMVFYGRVSTEHEAQLSALENQMQWYDDQAKYHKNWTVLKKYIDRGITGTQAKKRPAFMEMLEDAKKHKFDLIVTREVCRFARNTVDTLVITRQLKEIGIEVYFVEDNIWTMDNDGELRLSLMATLAQEESRKTSERVRAGQKISRDKGVLYGSGNILGYDRVGDTYVINEEQAETVRIIYDLYLKGYGFMKIVNELVRLGRKDSSGEVRWECTKVSRILHNATYKGYQGYYKSYKNNYLDQKTIVNRDESTYLYVKGKYTPIISEEIWDKCKAIREKKTAERVMKTGKIERLGNTLPKDIWSKRMLCRCGYHFRKDKWHMNKSGLTYGYKCYNQLNHGSKKARIEAGLDADKYCDMGAVADWKMDLMLWKIISVLKMDNSAIVREAYDLYTLCLDGKSADALTLKEQEMLLQKEQNKLDNLADMRMGGEITKEEFLTYKARVNDSISKIQKVIEKLKEKVDDGEEKPPIISLEEFQEIAKEELDFSKPIKESGIVEGLVKLIIPNDGQDFKWYLDLFPHDSSLGVKDYREAAVLKVEYDEARDFRHLRSAMLRPNQWKDLTIRLMV